MWFIYALHIASSLHDCNSALIFSCIDTLCYPELYRYAISYSLHKYLMYNNTICLRKNISPILENFDHTKLVVISSLLRPTTEGFFICVRFYFSLAGFLSLWSFDINFGKLIWWSCWICFGLLVSACNVFSIGTPWISTIISVLQEMFFLWLLLILIHIQICCLYVILY